MKTNQKGQADVVLAALCFLAILIVIKQEFIGAFGDALRDGKIQQIVYVPTEANIPVLEAGKRPVVDE
ncbi:TPA: hypothetical protein OXP51_000718 [Acinetobacter baumannii]|nr:hypothetical protein [Acinetobacter baumannii]HCW5815420.1 hypothetical protein [Acinetobacter baumannii]